MSQTITVTLTAACGAVGTATFQPDDQLGPVAWDREPEGETVSAEFRCTDEDGDVYEPHELDGDEWRELEGEGSPERIPFYCRHGIDLATAVGHATLCYDPDNFDEETAQELDDLRGRIALCERYSAELDRLEIAPNGDDFNALMALLQGGAYEAPTAADR